MDDLIEWYGAQLDADERIARDAGGLAWYRPAEYLGDPAAIRDSEHERVVCYEGWPSEGQAAHIAEWDPARVLREIEADRDLLRQYKEVSANDVDEQEYAHGWANALGFAVRLRASAYRDRPGYREEWRP
jgi:hypothetical protein